MRAQFTQSIDFNQMLVFSVFGHLVILTIVLFLPKPSQTIKAVVPAFMVSLVEVSSGNKSAVQKKPVLDRKAPIKNTKPKVKNTAAPKKTIKKKVVKKKSPPKPNKILTALEKLDKKAAAVAPVPVKKMLEELDQLAVLERPKKPIAKPKMKSPVLEETFRELKDKKIDLKKEISPEPVANSLLEDFEELKMEEVIEQKTTKKQPVSNDEKVDAEKSPVVEKRNLLRELEKLAKLESTIKNDERAQFADSVVEEKESKAYDSVLEKFESLTVRSSRLKVEVGGTKLDESKFQSRLRTLPDSPEHAESNDGSDSYVFSDREGTPGADFQSLYAGLVQEKIYKNWRDPLAERHSKEAIISFHIFPQGNIDKPFIKQSSGVEALDALAVGAVLDSVPFPPFPKELKMSNLFLSIYFKYVPKDD